MAKTTQPERHEKRNRPAKRQIRRQTLSAREKDIITRVVQSRRKMHEELAKH